MAHVQPRCCLFIPQGLGEHEERQGGRWVLGEVLTKALSWHQGWEKRRKGTQEAAGLTCAVQEALWGAGWMFCWQSFSAFLRGASFNTVIFSLWFVRHSASLLKTLYQIPICCIY